MNVRTESRRSVNVPLGGGATLKITMAPDSVVGDSLVIARGFGGSEPGDSFRRPHWCGEPLVLPASVLPALRAALDDLEVEQ